MTNYPPVPTIPGEPITMEDLAGEVIYAGASMRDAHAEAFALLEAEAAAAVFEEIGLRRRDLVHGLVSCRPLTPGPLADLAGQAADRLAVRAMLRDDDTTAWMAETAAALHAVLDAGARHRRAVGLLQAMVDALV